MILQIGFLWFKSLSEETPGNSFSTGRRLVLGHILWEPPGMDVIPTLWLSPFKEIWALDSQLSHQLRKSQTDTERKKKSFRMWCTVMFTVLKASLLSLLHSKSPICFPQVTSHKKRLLETPRQSCHSQVTGWHGTIYLYHPPVWKAGAALFNMKKKKQGESCSSDLWIHQELTSWNLNKHMQAGTGCNSFRQTKCIRQQEA